MGFCLLTSVSTVIKSMVASFCQISFSIGSCLTFLGAGYGDMGCIGAGLQLEELEASIEFCVLS